MMKNGGWFHPFNDSPRPVFIPAKRIETHINARSILHEWRDCETYRLQVLAGVLGVTRESLNAIGACYAPPHHAFAFPMRDEHGEPVGIRLRSQTGEKWAVRGSRNGLFLNPEMSQSNRIYICEGPTDTAAGISLGLNIIGRPACRGCEDMTLKLIQILGARECVLIFDNDGPGVHGAEDFARRIPVRTFRFIPPCKDFREFVRLGGTPDLIETMLKSALATRAT